MNHEPSPACSRFSAFSRSWARPRQRPSGSSIGCGFFKQGDLPGRPPTPWKKEQRPVYPLVGRYHEVTLFKIYTPFSLWEPGFPQSSFFGPWKDSLKRKTPVCLLQRLFARVCRLRMANPPCRWGKQPGTQMAKLRVILKDDAWQEEGPWRWFHPVSRLRLVIPAAAGKANVAHGTHQLREAWRGATLTKWAKGARHEAQAWRASDADICHAAQQVDFAWLRTFLDRCDGATGSVLLGAVVSPA